MKRLFDLDSRLRGNDIEGAEMTSKLAFKLPLVKKLALLIILLCSSALAAEFSAGVDRTELALNNSLVLTIKLSDTTAKSSPDFSGVKELFDIVGIAQASNTTIINTKSSSSTEWHLTLKPKAQGNAIIPAITVDTSHGKLSTEAIAVKIAASEPTSTIDKNSGIFTESSVDNKKPYKFEPFIYTVKLFTTHDVRDVIFSPLELEGLTVKLNGAYKVYPSTYNGNPIHVIELSYIVTPLRSGQITIPGTKITGIYTTHKSTGFSGLFDSIFENARSNNVVSKSKEFTVQSKEFQLEILPPAANITPWLPAKELYIKDNIEQGDMMVGKPIKRIITIKALGLRGNQLPAIDSELTSSDDYKIYAEIPEINDHVENKIISSQRKDIYTIIPQKSGKITLPPIDIKWWNVKESKLMHATLPAKTLQIKPSDIASTNIENNISSEEQELPESNIKDKNNATIPEESGSSWLVIFVVLLCFGGAFTIYKLVKLRPTIKPLLKTKPIISSKRQSTFAINDLKSVSSASELCQFLRNYTHVNFGLAKNASLGRIFDVLEKNSPEIKGNRHNLLMKKIEGILYSDNDFYLTEIKKECKALLKLAKKGKNKKPANKESTLPQLNPISKD